MNTLPLAVSVAPQLSVTLRPTVCGPVVAKALVAEAVAPVSVSKEPLLSRSHSYLAIEPEPTSLDPAALNSLRPGRKPFHTLNPALARLKDGRVMLYGTMGVFARGPVAGIGFFGASGGSGTKSVFSTTLLRLFHLRSNWFTYHDTRSAFDVKMLCST